VKFDWVVIFNGVEFAIGLGIAGYRSSLVRFWILAALSLGAGLGISLTTFDTLPGMALFFTLQGAATLISGGWTLAVDLKETQADLENEDE
jgi:hypothetical protein